MHQINQQEPMRVDRAADGTLSVHSIFRTIQGEGPFAGHRALFIRLVGCNLQCPGCDTDYTSKVNDNVTPQRLLAVMHTFYEWKSGLVVITGGEPFRQNITPFVELLLSEEYTVQVESNGVLFPGMDFPWIHPKFTLVVSPKTGKIHPRTAVMAHAFKYVLSWDNVAPDGLPTTALHHPLAGFKHVARPPVGWDGPVYLQPMEEHPTPEAPRTELDTTDRTNKLNMKAVANSCMEHGYIMGVQMHKLTGLP